MSIVNESKIKSYSSSVNHFSGGTSLSDYRSESKSNKVTVFLSHKHDETELLTGAISFLKQQGVDVYVDWMDSGMPTHTSGETAKRIKEKIKENDKFILLASEAAINSKWCNWELGLGDAEKYSANISLLPMLKDKAYYAGAEYLQIYPHIEYEDGTSKYNNGNIIEKGYYVIYYNENEGRVFTSLESWLSS